MNQGRGWRGLNGKTLEVLAWASLARDLRAQDRLQTGIGCFQRLR